MSPIPKLKRKVYTERITLPIEPEMKDALVNLKSQYGVDISEWLRLLIQSNIEVLKKQAQTAS